MTDHDFGVNVLRYWYKASLLPQLGFVQYPDAIAHYDKESPTFIATFGSAVRKLEQSKYVDAMQELGKSSGDRYPSVNEFFNAVAKHATDFTWTDVKAVAADSAKDVGKVAAIGGSIVLIGVAIGAAIYISSFRRR